MKHIIQLYIHSKNSPEDYIRYKVAVKMYAEKIKKELWEK